MKLEELLKGVDPSLEGRIKRAFCVWNAKIRAFLREESRLSLKREGHGGKVPVNVVPGYPMSLAKLGDLDVNVQAEHMVAVRKQATCAVSDLEAYIERLETLPEISIQQRQVHASALVNLRGARDHLKKTLQFVIAKAVAKKILEVDEDVLGIYRHTALKGEIRIYWAVIGFAAQSLNIDPEGLAIVVLIHELAHAYTHLGLDADGRVWAEFAKVGSPIKEALAQYYTHLGVHRFMGQNAILKKSYFQLLDHQPLIYRRHLEWAQSIAPEVVRSAVLEARQQKISELAEFEEIFVREVRRI